MAHRDLIVVDDDGNLTTNRGLYSGLPNEPHQEEPIEVPPGGARFRKKPVEVVAMQMTDNLPLGAVEEFCGSDNVGPGINELVAIWNEPEAQWIDCPVGHYIIRGIVGEFYPCDPDIFRATYDAVESDD